MWLLWYEYVDGGQGFISLFHTEKQAETQRDFLIKYGDQCKCYQITLIDVQED